MPPTTPSLPPVRIHRSAPTAKAARRTSALAITGFAVFAAASSLAVIAPAGGAGAAIVHSVRAVRVVSATDTDTTTVAPLDVSVAPGATVALPLAGITSEALDLTTFTVTSAPPVGTVLSSAGQIVYSVPGDVAGNYITPVAGGGTGTECSGATGGGDGASGSGAAGDGGSGSEGSGAGDGGSGGVTGDPGSTGGDGGSGGVAGSNTGSTGGDGGSGGVGSDGQDGSAGSSSGCCTGTGSGAGNGSGTDSGCSGSSGSGSGAAAADPVTFSYSVCTDSSGSDCFGGAVDVTIDPGVLVPIASAAITVSTDSTTIIPPSTFLSADAGADWSTLTAMPRAATSTAGGGGAVTTTSTGTAVPETSGSDAGSVSYVAPAESGAVDLQFGVCPFGDPSTCVTGSILVTVVAPAVTAAPTTSTLIPVMSGPAPAGRGARASSDTATAGAGSPASAVEPGAGLTWYVIGGALVFMFGSGATVLASRKH